MSARIVVLDLGNVVISYDAVPAVAAGVGADEADRFFAEFDFADWNHRQDAGRPFAEADAWVAEHAPQWLTHTRAYREHFGLTLLGEVPGTATVIADLVAVGTPLFALTNWSSETWPIATERFEVLGAFGDVVVSGDLRLAKPDPAIYGVTTERLGYAPAEVFFTDDSPANVEAARAAGWDAELFNDADALRAQLVARGLLGGASTPPGSGFPG